MSVYKTDRHIFKIVAVFLVLTCLTMSLARAFSPEIILNFNGRNTVIETDVNAQDLGLDGNAARTAEAWVYTRSFNNAGIFYMGTTHMAGGSFSLRTTSGTDEWMVQYWGGGHDIEFEYPSQDRWVHFALVHTGSETIVYADGEEIVREERTLNTSSEEPFYIGRWLGDVFHGKIAEVRLWNRPLSSEDINDNMHERLQGDEEGLVGYWPLSEGRGYSAKDLAQGNDGSFAGDLEWDPPPFIKNLDREKNVEPWETVVLGPVELREPVGEVKYQWYHNDEAIEGGEDNVLELTDVRAENLGIYYVRVTDESGLAPAESRGKKLPEWPSWREDIDEERIFKPGGTVTLGPVELYDPYGDVTYQWYKDDNLIEGATSASLTIEEISDEDFGTYHVVADDDLDSTPVESSSVEVLSWMDAYVDAENEEDLVKILTGSRLLSEAEKIEWEETLREGTEPATELYDELHNRALDSTPKIAYVRRGGYGIRPTTNATMWSHRTHRGSAIVVVDPTDPEDEGEEIFSTGSGFIFDIHPSYDGEKLLMTYKEDVSKPFHIWEINIDGSGLRQLTDGPYHDVTPAYYPDGRIVFSSTRMGAYSMCQNYLATTLYICDEDGDDIRRIAYDTLCSITPGIMGDGTISASRWEYMDKTLWTWQGLWTVHPNGRMLQLLYGQTFHQPEALYAPRQVPGSNEVVFVMTGHYSAPIGDLGIVNRRLGVENPESARKLTDHTRLYFEGNQGDLWTRTRLWPDFRTDWRGYTDPWPFSRELSLATYLGDPSGRESVVLVDHGSIVYPLHTDTQGGAFSPVALSKREKPNAIVGDAPQEEGKGTFYVQDIYEGLLEQGVERGDVEGLRIWRQTEKKYNTEGGRIHDHYPLIGWGTYYVKELYGTVPIRDDGSLIFHAPANVELYFSAVDDKGREIQRMGSITQITPGDAIGCVGCHEPRDMAPPPMAGPDTNMMWSEEPETPTPPPWVEAPPGPEEDTIKGYPINYPEQVQPVLDRHCIECHNPTDHAGGIDLTADKSRFFNMSYENLVVRNSGLHHSANTTYVEYYHLGFAPGGHFPALKTGSMVSKLVEMILDGHQGVELTEEEINTVTIWIDANIPYYGTWEMSRPRTRGGRDLFQTVSEGTWSDYEMAPSGDRIQNSDWFAKVEDIMSELGLDYGWENTDLINFTRPEYSRLLLENLSSEAGGRADSEEATFQSTDDENYQRLLDAITQGAEDLERYPRMDMPEGRAIPQPREFDRVF